MARQYFLGVDGGQTSTAAVLCDENGILLGQGHSGPSNHVHEAGGMERMRNALRQSIEAAFADAHLSLCRVEAAYCGMTGGAEYVPQLWPHTVPTGKLVAEHDTVTAHAGALAGGPGVIIIAGTGSVAFGVNRAGERARAGGWAYIMGDEGSAYDLGRQALMAAARADDGRGPATSLLEAILHRFGKASLWEVREAIYRGEIDRVLIGQIAPLVVAASNAGDAIAHGILERGCKELAEATIAVLRRLAMIEEEAIVAPVGGLFQAGQAITIPFSQYLAQSAPLARLRPPLYPPVLGAVLLAMRLSEIAIDEAVRQHLAVGSQKLSLANKGGF